jgi:hypothetical protein
MYNNDLEKAQMAAPLTGSGYGSSSAGGSGLAGGKRPHEPAPMPALGVRDPLFLFLFLGNVIAVCYYAFTSGLSELSDSTDDSGSVSLDESTKKILYATLCLAGFAALLTGCVLTVLMRNAESLIRFTLWFNIVICFVLAVFMVMISPFISIFFMLFCLLNWCYMRAVQNRIPYVRGQASEGRERREKCCSFSPSCSCPSP